MLCPNCEIELPLHNGAYKCPRCVFIGHPNHLKIDAMWAYISVDDKENEGLIALSSPLGPMPAVGADEARMLSLRPLVADVSRVSKMKVKLIKFSQREVLEEL